MGVDYIRFRLKADPDHDILETLIERQAVAFQSIWGWGGEAGRDESLVQLSLNERLHLETYLTASDQLLKYIEFPEWDEQTGCATDIPELKATWRVYPIASNPGFPPLQRMLAQRTIEPAQLEAQLAEWKTWAQEVIAGKHDDYVKKLHMLETRDVLRDHWSWLRRNAIASEKKTANWAKKPRLHEVRQEILPLPEPAAFIVPIDVPKRREACDDDSYAKLLLYAQRLLDLTREWNRNVKGNWKLPNYTDNYCLTLDDFKASACGHSLSDFFAWVDCCVANDFGLYLDY